MKWASGEVVRAALWGGASLCVMGRLMWCYEAILVVQWGDWLGAMGRMVW